MKCPYCGGETDANRPFCRHCGKRIDSMQVEPVPNSRPGGDLPPYGAGGNSSAPYSGRGKESRSRGDILMIVIGVILAAAAVGIAVFILTHMVGSDNTVRRKDSSVTSESKRTESKKTESPAEANSGTKSKESGTEAVAPSGDAAEATQAPTETPTPVPTETPIPALAAAYSYGSMPGEIASLFRVTITDGEASSELHQKEGIYDNSPQMVYDGDPVTSWQHGTEGNGTGQQLRFTFNTANIRAICLKLGNWRTPDLYRQNSRPSRMQLTLGGETVDVSFTDNMQNHYIVFNRPVPAADILITITAAYDGADYNDCCISEMELYAE